MIRIIRFSVLVLLKLSNFLIVETELETEYCTYTGE